MHKLATTPITLERFEIDDLNADFELALDEKHTEPLGVCLNVIIDTCEALRKKYNETKDKKYWKALIRILPESWLQTRTVTMNYENIINIYKQRKNHKLTEWSESFCTWAKSLPYMSDFLKYI